MVFIKLKKLGVDFSKWSPDTDRRGRDIGPGDFVSFRMYPKGTNRGILEFSTIFFDESDRGKRIATLVVRDEHGMIYGPVTNVLLIKKKRI